jgi:hypothetical protein
MGTSVSHRSPSTPNWRAVDAAYNSPIITTERLAQEIWRAAASQPGDNLATLLGAGVIASCAEAVVTAASPQQALAAMRRQFALSGEASIAGEIAQRATVTGFQSTGDRLTAFAAQLFSEASNYLVARDLPGFVGSSPRVPNVSAAAALKSEVCRHVAGVVHSLPCPPDTTASAPAWSAYVGTVVQALKGGA